MRKRIVSALLAVIVAFSIFAGFNRDVAAATKYSIKINVKQNVVTIYKSGKPYKAMLCSTGKVTPKKGTYKLTYRYRWAYLKGGVAGQYCISIKGNIWFHSVPYKKQTVSSLKYAEYDKLGTTCSAGCVRLSVKDAKWIYDNCKRGTPVTFYQSDNPGPLGKPTSYKITGAPPYYIGWDPTDPNKNNPWNRTTYYTQYTFNASQYLQYNPELRNTVGTNNMKLKVDWLTKGLTAGRRANDEFDVNFFKKMYPDLTAGMNNQAVDKYYNTTARKAGKMGSELSAKLKPAFDASYITSNNPDWKSVGTGTTALWNNFVDIGVSGNIQTSPIFDVSYYKKNNPDLAEKYGNDVYGYIRHFLETGMKEGKQGCASFNVKAFKDQHPELNYGNDYVKYFNYYLSNYKKAGIYNNPAPATQTDNNTGDGQTDKTPADNGQNTGSGNKDDNELMPVVQDPDAKNAEVKDNAAGTVVEDTSEGAVVDDTSEPEPEPEVDDKEDKALPPDAADKDEESVKNPEQDKVA